MTGVKQPMPGVSYLSTSVLKYHAAEGVLTEQTLTDTSSEASQRWPERVALSEPGVTLSAIWRSRGGLKT